MKQGAAIPHELRKAGTSRPKAGAKSLEQSAATVTTTRLVTGKSAEETVKTIAQGRLVDPVEPVVTDSYPSFYRMRGYGCGQRPAFPAPSVIEEQQSTRPRARCRAARAYLLAADDEKVEISL